MSRSRIVRIYIAGSFRSYGGEYKLSNEPGSSALDRNMFNNIVSSVRSSLSYDALCIIARTSVGIV